MTKEEINQKIAELEAQRDEIERQEREQAEAEKRKARAEREADLQLIHDLLDEFNKKYDDCLNVNRCQNTTEDWIKTLFRCL